MGRFLPYLFISPSPEGAFSLLRNLCLGVGGRMCVSKETPVLCSHDGPGLLCPQDWVLGIGRCDLGVSVGCLFPGLWQHQDGDAPAASPGDAPALGSDLGTCLGSRALEPCGCIPVPVSTVGHGEPRLCLAAALWTPVQSSQGCMEGG